MNSLDGYDWDNRQQAWVGYRYFLPTATARKANSDRMTRDDWPLIGPFQAEQHAASWPAGPYQADCWRKRHRVPDMLCSCGIRAFSTIEEAVEYLMAVNDVAEFYTGTRESRTNLEMVFTGPARQHAVITKVWLWGNTVGNSATERGLLRSRGNLDDDSTRFEYSELAEIYVPGSLSLQDARELKAAYGVPVLRSDQRGPEFWRELAPDAHPERHGCWPCTNGSSARRSSDYPVCANCEAATRSGFRNQMVVR